MASNVAVYKTQFVGSYDVAGRIAPIVSGLIVTLNAKEAAAMDAECEATPDIHRKLTTDEISEYQELVDEVVISNGRPSIDARVTNVTIGTQSTADLGILAARSDSAAVDTSASGTAALDNAKAVLAASKASN